MMEKHQVFTSPPQIHERKHTGETPYLCSICAKAFKRKEALDQHAIIHKDLPRVKTVINHAHLVDAAVVVILPLSSMR